MPPELPRQSTYAITISTFLHAPHFQVTAHAELFLETLFRYRNQGKFLLHGFAVMPNHVHLLLTPSSTLPQAIQLVKGGYSFAARKLTPKEIWHTGYHEHRIRDPTDYHNQLAYIANNPPASHLASGYPFVHAHPAHTTKLDPLPPVI